MAKMGRPKIKIDKNLFEKFCKIQCTEQEIADFFNCSVDTINRWCLQEYKLTFADTFKKKSVDGKMSLRRNQFRMSENNPTMAIWLGKQYLGQSDNIKVENKELSKLDELLEGIKKNATK